MTNSSAVRVPSRTFECRAWRGAILSAALWSGAASAELELIPYASSQLQYDSNVFRVSNTAAAQVIDGKQVRSDGVLSTVLGLETNYLFGEQRLRGQIEGRRFDYKRITGLNRFEYLFGGALDWVLFSNVNGTVDFKQERRLASFADRRTSRLIFDRDRIGGGQINIVVGNDWRVEGGYHLHELLAPLPTSPQFTLREDTATAALKYLGVARITAGIGGEYVNGSFRGSPNDANFNQYSGQATLGYEASGLSSFNLAVGVTTRDDPTQGGKNTEFTGNIGYKRQITGKTSAGARVFRRVVSYDAGANSVVETGGGVNVDWEATSRITVGTAFEYTNGAFSATALTGAPNANGSRRDRYKSVTLNVSYEILRWLQLRAYGTYQDRISNIETNSYNDALTGLELKVRFLP